MAFTRDFGYDPLTGTKETFVINDDRTFSIVSTTDIEPILAANYEDRKVDRPWGGRWEKDGETFSHYARIPLGVYYSLPKDLRQDGKALLQWLQKSDQMPFRTRTGTVV